MTKTNKYLNEMKRIFARARDKHEANYQSANVMAEMSADAEFFSEVLQKHLQKAETLNTLHYPVVGIDIELNEYFGLVANCWIPLPDKATNMSTKAIHHHGDMLLTTATAFGTGYEHWMFETPTVVDAEKEIYELKLLEKAAHPLNHVAFVDAYIAHLPLYPPDLTITYALWSSRFPTTWKDKLKRQPLLQKNSKRLRDLAAKIGLAKQLELKVVEYFDFYPSEEGFRGIKTREEFARTNNEDYLASLFQVIQETGNEKLAPVIRQKLNSGEKINNRGLVENHLKDLESGKHIEGRISPEHYGVPQANFTAEEIFQAIDVQNVQGKGAAKN
ncbi:MAG TPA: hypothetical protein PKE69_21190 [Pyrinomonadaceae bacterium]|nr:hypothetical protein [Pyrinomonadaceae bacterium]